MPLHKTYFLIWITANQVLLSRSEWIVNYMDLEKFYFTRLLTVVSASLCYLHGLLLIYTLLEQVSNSEPSTNERKANYKTSCELY